MKLIPTIFFPGACKDAIAFYREALGAVVLFDVSVGELVPPDAVRPGTEHRTLRAGLQIGDDVIYLSDGHGPAALSFEGFGLSLQAASMAEAERMMQALSEGGKVQIALRKTAWAAAFGTVTDKFNLRWAIEFGTSPLLAHAQAHADIRP